MTFTDRFHAGRLLSASLVSYRDRTDVIVMALPRGGVLVGYEVATRLQVPLDVLVVRKISLPDFPEMAIGAMAPDGINILSERIIKRFRISPEILGRAIAAEEEELRRRTHCYREDRSYPDLHEKTVILVDDGLATGRTMGAAITWTRSREAKEIVVAVPVGAAETCLSLSKEVDRVICLSMPADFQAVGLTYLDFRQVTDAEVIAALRKAEEDQSFSPSSAANWPSALPANRLGSEIPLVKTARIKLSSPQAAEIGLTDGRIVCVKGEAAREPINAIASAKGSPHYHSTFGVPLEGGQVLVVGVDGSHLDAVFKN
jgi:putative phosphoribosyl transferase